MQTLKVRECQSEARQVSIEESLWALHDGLIVGGAQAGVGHMSSCDCIAQSSCCVISGAMV